MLSMRSISESTYLRAHVPSRPPDMPDITPPERPPETEPPRPDDVPPPVEPDRGIDLPPREIPPAERV